MFAAPKDIFIALLLMLGFLGIYFAIVYPYLSGDVAAQKRRARFIKATTPQSGGARTVDPVQRRKHIAESLLEVEQREKMARRMTLDQRLVQAGLRMSKSRFYTWSNICGICLGLVLFVFIDNPFMIALGYAIGGFGVPRAILSFLRHRRMSRFIDHFASAIDVIIRGARAGLPLAECMKVVARELPEPVRSEFVIAMESQTVGLTLAEAIERMSERVPVPEARFFAILISIQQKSGGNLAEGLSNLSTVLRDRKKLSQKIKAMSAEAKASAGIIGSLPFVVALLVSITSPGYMDILWTTPEGQTMLMLSAIWMILGILVMKRMISFDF